MANEGGGGNDSSRGRDGGDDDGRRCVAEVARSDSGDGSGGGGSGRSGNSGSGDSRHGVAETARRDGEARRARRFYLGARRSRVTREENKITEKRGPHSEGST